MLRVGLRDEAPEGQQRVGIHGTATVGADLMVQVAPGHVARGAHLADEVSAGAPLAGCHAGVG
jgi:hypothetical protein